MRDTFDVGRNFPSSEALDYIRDIAGLEIEGPLYIEGRILTLVNNRESDELILVTVGLEVGTKL